MDVVSEGVVFGLNLRRNEGGIMGEDELIG